MTVTLLALLLIGGITLFWSASRQAADQARQAGRLACERAGVQLLDQTVMLSRLALRRNEQGSLRILRQYSFDYSRTGSDRSRGSMGLLGDQLQWITDPGAGHDD